MNLWSTNAVNRSQIRLSLEIYGLHFPERWTCTYSIALEEHSLCGHSEGGYCHHPLWVPWDFITKLCHCCSVVLRKKAQERARGSWGNFCTLNWSSLAGQWALVTFLCLSHQHWCYGAVPKCYMGAGDPNSGLHICKAIALPTEQLPYSQEDSFFLCFATSMLL